MTPRAYEEVSDGLDGTVAGTTGDLNTYTIAKYTHRHLDLVTLTQLVELQFM